MDFLEIFNETKDDIYRLVFRYMKNNHDTDDIVQNVFVKLYKQLGRLKTREHAKRWLIRVAVNECKNHFKSSWVNKIIPFEEHIDEVEPQNSNDDVLQAILELPQKYRVVVHLYYYGDYSIKEIAELLKIKESAIQTQLGRAREKLKTILSPYTHKA
jgi:RNA polymerase sigma-70 factor (ECF subfamily)